MKPLDVLGIVVTILCILFIVTVIFSLPIMWLWNSTMPELFGFKEITWWMAWKLAMLSGLLFGVRSSSK